MLLKPNHISSAFLSPCCVQWLHPPMWLWNYKIKIMHIAFAVTQACCEPFLQNNLSSGECFALSSAVVLGHCKFVWTANLHRCIWTNSTTLTFQWLSVTDISNCRDALDTCICCGSLLIMIAQAKMWLQRQTRTISEQTKAWSNANQNNRVQ